MKPYILVIGSSNTDMVVKADRLPAPGETILGGTFLITAGGKGANQAVAAARLGGDVVFIVKVGDDIFGRQAVQSFNGEGIDTSHIITDPVNPSGVALITVDAKAENCIVVASGANANLKPGDLYAAEEKIKSASLILMQLEIPLETVEYVAELASIHNVPLILNPAPACALSDELLSKVSIITPNQKEAEMLTGARITDKESAQTAAELLAEKGIETVIITMGANGALVFHGSHFDWVPAPVVNAVDTTAAGDVFNGALAVAMSEGKNIDEAVIFSNKAAALSVTKMGAQASAPYRRETEDFS
ncbi:MAG TPA: ribokinase [Mucilaginibacter sp.]|jgi:ribokinase|nr:ribokinase [Mucilaginibacter sp.]